MSINLISQSIELFKQSKIDDARSLLNIPESKLNLTDFISQITDIDTGFKLLSKHRIIEAATHFERGYNLIELSSDSEAKFVITLLIEFAYGIQHLHNGNPYDALHTFEKISTTAKEMSFLDSNLERFALSSKAAACIALSKIYMGTGNYDEVRRWQSEAEIVYEELYELLDEKDSNDIVYFIEIFSFKIEVATFWIYANLQILNIDEVKRIICSRSDTFTKFKKYIQQQQQTREIDNMAHVIKDIYNCYIELSSVFEDTIYKQKMMTKENVAKLKSITQSISEIKELLSKCGQRGLNFSWFIKNLEDLTKNILTLNYKYRKNFGTLSGLITGTAFIIIVLILKLLFNLELNNTNLISILFFSLIVGFGYGALRFLPLIKEIKNIVSKND